MKIEKLSKGRYIKTSIIVLVVISIFGVIFINKSKAKYRVTQSIQIVNGTVNYKLADLNVLALYKQKNKGDTSDNNYESITDVPSGNYVVNTDKSYCTIPEITEQQKNIPMEYKDNGVYIKITKKGTKCYVYLDILSTAKDVVDRLGLKVNSTDEGCPAYEDAPSITKIEDTKSLLCRGIDDFGDTYYYRGKVTNNWVKLGNFYWRIIRFNGNGSIRLIYSGNGSPVETGDNALIGTSAYNNSIFNYNAKFVKYMADNMSNSTKNPKNSIIKQVIDDWYESKLKSFGSKLDGTAGFCNDADRQATTSFKPYDRIINRIPTLKCGTPKTNLFTTNDGTKGNQKLDYPIGLITVDEASFAGALWNSSNMGFYLDAGENIWTMSPYSANGSSYVGVFTVDFAGGLGNSNGSSVDTALGVRPVINLKADTQFTGQGTSTNPYVVI